MIYVDSPKHYPREHTKLPYEWWSHMWSSTNDVSELLKFADRLRLKREWLQDQPLRDGYRLPHFDVVPTKRTKALKLGAQPKELLDFLRENNGQYPPVIEWWQRAPHGLA